MRLALLLLVPLLAGCAMPTQDDAEPAPPTRALGSPAFETDKFTFQAPAPAAASPLDPLLGGPAPFSRELDIPRETGRLHLAFDLDGEGASTLRVSAGGRLLYESPEGSGPRKLVAVLDAPPGGPAQIEVENERPVTVGVVATAFPAGFNPGTIVMVAFPEQTEIDHSFRPARVDATTGQPARITLFDYDPHAGIENLQHNLAIPALGVKTEGRTTWGEARVLDFTPEKPGEYPFVCEFHKFSGTLVVR